MDTFRTEVQNVKFSALEHITVSTDGIESTATSGEAVKQFKRVKLTPTKQRGMISTKNRRPKTWQVAVFWRDVKILTSL